MEALKLFPVELTPDIDFSFIRIHFDAKHVEIANMLHIYFENLGGGNHMLYNAYTVWKRMYPLIDKLDCDSQINIIYECVMIAYDSRISAFDHMNNFNKDLKEGIEKKRKEDKPSRSILSVTVYCKADDSTKPLGELKCEFCPSGCAHQQKFITIQNNK